MIRIHGVLLSITDNIRRLPFCLVISIPENGGIGRGVLHLTIIFPCMSTFIILPCMSTFIMYFVSPMSCI